MDVGPSKSVSSIDVYVVSAIMSVIEKGRIGEVYHVSSNEDELTIANVVKSICDLTGFNFERNTKKIEENFGQDLMYSLSTNKIFKELNWEPKVNFNNGLKDIIFWLSENWEQIKTMPLEYVHKK